MKKNLLTILAVTATSLSFAQGIKFETGDWKSVLAKANVAHKLVYVDVYTTWCGPCKILATQVFPQKAAGDKYNKLFVNYRVDAEKGEGIELAKKYEVNGYPTNLFINPANGTVVYRTMGSTGEVAPFVAEADIAMLEKNDPMTWEKYNQQYKAGKKDKVFLKAYLNKAHRLNKDNDNILNDYVALLKAKPVDKAEVNFILDVVKTTDNDAVDYLYEHKDLLVDKMPGQDVHFEARVKMWSYGTFEKAVAAKDEKLLAVIGKSTEKYTGKREEDMDYWYRTQYFTKIGDEQGALKAGIAEANFLAAKTDDYFAKEDELALIENRSNIRQQLIMMKVPAAQLDEMVKVNVDRSPEMQHSKSAQTANTLNSISWTIYERHATDNDLLKQALTWSKRSLDLTNGMKDWPSFGDTYAHLLYASGNKEQAIKTQQEVVAKAKELKATGVDELEATLKQMQEGKL